MWPFEYKYNVQCFWLKRILNIIIQASIFRDYRNTCFWRPKCFGKAIPQIMTLQILSGNGALQIMPFQKLGGKCHFFLRFCTRKRSKTYKNCSYTRNRCIKWHQLSAQTWLGTRFRNFSSGNGIWLFINSKNMFSFKLK